MATNILMPALSPTMTEGTLARWLKKEGDSIKAGDVIAEIETDKATMEVEAVDEGVLGKILVADGSANIAVNEPIAILVEEGEAVPAAPAAAPAPQPPAQKQAPQKTEVASPTPKTEPAPGPKAPAPAGNGHDTSGERIFASPLARRMARQAGIDLRSLKGSGPNGRIIRADIEAARKGGVAPAAEARAPAAPAVAPAVAPPSAPPLGQAAAPAITAPHKLVPHTSMRKVIARRLSEAKATIPHFYVSMDIEIDALIDLMKQLNAKAPKEGPGAYAITINDLVIKAAAATLREMPTVNASWTDDGMVFYDDVDVSVAVAIPDGLITPIIRKADQKGLATISREMKDLAGRARAGKLKPEEFQGGGFSISNMGMFGVTEFAAVINPPQGAILAVAAGQKRPVVKNDALAIATVMTCTLSVDHRVVDGALGAQWLRAFKRLVEDPLGLLL
ncbi:pyruvate dehydrogenase complex dihydrolipoamide acetyltransferase [Rhodopila globiformis]|uniref:Acetyltransferase component of pyruvate dehydrogenase complex n=1 Tax=Rhodopila globiformis TaxID=1071 RepID=A0A2S6MU39_RHOGL|nr:pyruvate dehydrogenase complex dihydrolipoamide acetyltransferase [Rhodopila globiformis]PPQ25880.1 pyruvate dehydrogenase complex dihydrolipoamide acetyltransferase [Rhodopila globiformis]